MREIEEGKRKKEDEEEEEKGRKTCFTSLENWLKFKRMKLRWDAMQRGNIWTREKNGEKEEWREREIERSERGMIWDEKRTEARSVLRGENDPKSHRLPSDSTTPSSFPSFFFFLLRFTSWMFIPTNESISFQLMTRFAFMFALHWLLSHFLLFFFLISHTQSQLLSLSNLRECT